MTSPKLKNRPYARISEVASPAQSLEVKGYSSSESWKAKKRLQTVQKKTHVQKCNSNAHKSVFSVQIRCSLIETNQSQGWAFCNILPTNGFQGISDWSPGLHDCNFSKQFQDWPHAPRTKCNWSGSAPFFLGPGCCQVVTNWSWVLCDLDPTVCLAEHYNDLVQTKKIKQPML